MPIEEIKMASGYVVKTAIALRDSMLSNIEKYYGQSKARKLQRIMVEYMALNQKTLN